MESPEQENVEGGAETYGGDPDAEPPASGEQVEADEGRDQAEG